VGQLEVPLTAFAASGAEYRLRDAEFTIGTTFSGSGGSGTTSPAPAGLVVSSEDDPAASKITVELEEGEYFVELQPGWRLEKMVPGGGETVEATLLSETGQWVWVSRRSSSLVEYHFGLGDRSIWFNGKLNIDIRVSETPGTAGSGGYAGSGGAGGYAGSGGAGSSGGFPSGGYGGSVGTGGGWIGAGGSTD
jgi:hypothetical protein